MTNDEELLDGKSPEDISTFWKRAIETEKKRHKKWRDQAKEAQDAYDEENAFNIMWPSIQITMGALYSSTPDPEVRRRQRDGDELQKQAAQIMERAISFCVDSHDFDGNAEQGIQDYTVAGMGQGKLNYQPEFAKRTIIDQMTQLPEEEEYISAQCTALEHFSWKHFGWQPCKRWENVDWVYFEHQKRRKDVRDEYGVDPSEEADSDDSDNKYVKVWEIWHKPSRARIYIAEQFDKPLSITRDELGLRSFFPCPRPMFTNLATDKLLPAPDFKYIKTQFNNLKRVSKRLKGLSEAIKAAGYYDTSFAELAKLQKARDGQYIPVDQLLAKLQDTNLDSVIAEMPIDHKIAVAAYLVEEKQRLIDEVYEILGISDIMRGETNAQEGVETQQLKSEFGAIRIRDKQREVNRFCRDVFRIMGEIIAEHFEPEILQKITGIEITPEVMEILRDDFLRNVSVDIETDSTNAGDKLRHKQEANETLQTVITGLMEILGAMANGLPKPVGQELALMLVRSVNGNTGNLEDILSKMGDEGSPESIIMQLEQQLAEAQQQMAAMEAELQKHDQADTEKKLASAGLDQARTAQIAQKLPIEQAQGVADVEQTRVETSGKRVEQAANLHTAMQPREPFLRGIE